MLTALSIFFVSVLLVIGAIGCFGEVTRPARTAAAQPKGSPVYELVKRIERDDAVRALEILRGDHGLFRFEEMKWREPDADDPYEDEGYWAPSICSGLYDSAEAAEQDARAEIAWFREMSGA